MMLLLLLLVSAGAFLGCASATVSQWAYVRPLHDQSATRVLVDKDECERAPSYPACMIARGYEAEASVPFFVNQKWGERRKIEISYVIGAEQPMSEAGALDAIRQCSEETTAALAPIKQYLSGDTAIGAMQVWGLGLVLLPFAAIDDARVYRVIDRTFPLCMARRSLAVRSYSPSQGQGR